MALISKLTAIGDAIRSKTGGTELIALADMPAEIEAIGSNEETETIWRALADDSFEGELSDDEIETLRVYAFYGCTGITSASFPAVTSVGSCAFYKCVGLVTVDFPAATSIGGSTFLGCTALATVNLPLATSIDGYAFSDCAALESIDLPAASSLGNNAFRNCTALSTMELPAVTSIDSYVFYNCTSLTAVGFPLAETLGSAAFLACTSLTSADFPVAASISTSSFRQCSALTALIIRTDEACTLSSTSAFTDTPIANGTGYIYVPSDLVEEYQAATNWSTYADQFRAIEDYPDICGES